MLKKVFGKDGFLWKDWKSLDGEVGWDFEDKTLQSGNTQWSRSITLAT